MAEERVQKILARAGYGSRRASEDLISAGRVRINGVVAELGSKADPKRDKITVDNQPIARAEAPVYIALNKPRGILSEVSPEEERETVRDLVSVPGHMFIVGRLDLESEGLILLTNDGELANKLTHPRYGHEKEYRVLVGTRPDEEQMQNWRRGIILEDGHRTAPAEVRLEGISGKNAWLRVVLHEGRKRQIREMGRLTGLPVLRIVRIRIGSLALGELKPGEWRELRPDEVRALRVPAMRSPQPRVSRRPGLAPSRHPAGRQAADRRGTGSSREERGRGERARADRGGEEQAREDRAREDRGFGTGRAPRGLRPAGRDTGGKNPAGASPRGGQRRSAPPANEGGFEVVYPRSSTVDRRSSAPDRRPASGRPSRPGREEDRPRYSHQPSSGERPATGSRSRPSRPGVARRAPGSAFEDSARPETGGGARPTRPAAQRRPSAPRGTGSDRPPFADQTDSGSRRPARPRPSSGQRPGGAGSRAPRGSRRVNRNRSS